MVYCSNCGEELPKDALFCPKCGAKATTKAPSSSTPSDEMHEALTKMGLEMEKAFSIAAKQMQEAFKTAKENVQKAAYKEPIVCSNCGEKNAVNATYCFKCGKSLAKAKPESET